MASPPATPASPIDVYTFDHAPVAVTVAPAFSTIACYAAGLDNVMRAKPISPALAAIPDPGA